MRVPDSPLGRFRWGFLAFALLFLLVSALLLVTASTAPVPREISGLLGVAPLAACWLVLYRRARPTPALFLVEAPALAAIAVGIGIPERALGIFYAGICFRALYGARRDVVIATGAYLGAFVAAVVVSGDRSAPNQGASAVVQAVGFALSAAIIVFLRRSLRRHEAAVARERALARAGVALVAARDGKAVHATAVETALALLADRPAARATIAVGGPAGMTVVATAGAAAGEGEPRGRTLDGEALASGRLPGALARDGIAAAVTPLGVKGQCRGAIIVESRAALDEEHLTALRTLGAQVALALEGMRLAEARFHALVQHSSDVISVVNGAGEIVYQSPSVERIFGFEPAALLETRLEAWVHPDDAAVVAERLAEVRRGDTPGVALEHRVRHADGGWRHVESALSTLLGDPGVHGVVLNTRDVSDRKRLESELSHRAFHDPLTQLANRALFEDRVRHALEPRGPRHSPLAPVAVLALDLDDFKSVNDSHGRGVGDRLLVQLAQRLVDTVRPSDTVARIGGDEFMILLEGLPSTDVVGTIADRVLDAVRRPLPLPSGEATLTGTLGIAVSRGDVGADDLLANADVAMYAAKARAGGRYALYEPAMHDTARRRRQLETELRQAVDRAEFVLDFQPIVALERGTVIGMEALVRWRHPEHGIVPPNDFLPLAEDTGLILPIGEWVLEHACRRVRAWQLEAPDAPPVRLSVNLCALQLQQPDIVDVVRRALERSELPPRSLILELTESALIQDAESIIRRLRAMRELGVRIAIDDFGTGYSSLSYLRNFPVDVLKIHKTFVDHLGQEERESALVHAIITLGDIFGLKIVAEGIERPEQLAELRRLRCHYGQGYLFSRPVDERAMGELLRRREGLPAVGRQLPAAPLAS